MFTSRKNFSLLSLWNFLTEPSKAIQQPDQRRQARMLSAMLFFLVCAALFIFFRPRPVVTNLFSPVSVITVSLALAVYLFSRTKHTRWVAVFTVLAAHIVPITAYLFTIANPNRISVTSTLYYLLISVLVSSLFLPIRATLGIIVADVVFLMLAPQILPPKPPLAFDAIMFLSVMSGLLVVFVRFRDLLEKDRQSELQALNHELRQKNADLVKANALAKESARLKSEFMATMSHELRTPLNAMLGFSSILLEGMGGEIDTDARHMVNRIDSNSKRLLSLINDVLDIAKIEAGRLEIVSVPIEPRKLVETWQSEMSVLAEQKGLIFKTEIDPDLPEKLYGDPERIRQVVANLLSNAFKFTEAGSVQLTLKKAEDKLLIEVNDTGIGIPPHAINFIFDEFRQIDGSYKRSYGGSGLGLAIARKLCLMMDGSIRVNSTPGAGSTFTVTLPLKPVEDLVVA